MFWNKKKQVAEILKLKIDELEITKNIVEHYKDLIETMKTRELFLEGRIEKKDKEIERLQDIVGSGSLKTIEALEKKYDLLLDKYDRTHHELVEMKRNAQSIPTVTPWPETTVLYGVQPKRDTAIPGPWNVAENREVYTGDTFEGIKNDTGVTIFGSADSDKVTLSSFKQSDNEEDED